jgi:hypothetical protein
MCGEFFGTLTFKKSQTGTAPHAQSRLTAKSTISSAKRPPCSRLKQVSMFPNEFPSGRQTRPYRVAVVNVAGAQVALNWPEEFRLCNSTFHIELKEFKSKCEKYP